MWTALAAALCLAGCVTPLGPGYGTEQQELNAEYISVPQPAVRVRASWRVKNTGNQPLDAIDVGLPAARTHTLIGLGAVVDETATGPLHAASDSVHIPFSSPLAIGETCEIAVSYELQSAGGNSAGAGITEEGFILPPGDWAPFLLRPNGTFASGGEPPKKWDLTVRVPEGWRVHASGKPHGVEHRKEAPAETAAWRFEQRPDGYLPFAVGGALREGRAKVSGDEVIVWTREPVPPGLIQSGAEAAAQTAQFYDAEFGPRGDSNRKLWVIECPLKRPCWAVPDAALVDAGIGRENSWSGFLVELEQQLAYTWLDFQVHPDWQKEPLPMGAMADFATELATAEREGGNTRTRIIHSLLANFDYQKEREPEPPVPSVQLSDPASARAFAGVKSELFLFALEDEAGRENLLRAVQHLRTAYRGGTWHADDLRSAVEQESGKNLAPLFRAWLIAPGIPDEFRSRY